MSASEPISTPEDDLPPRSESESAAPRVVPPPVTSPPPRKVEERPDWLVGAEEGAAAEHERSDRDKPEVKLQRPASMPVEGLELGGDSLGTGTPAGPGLSLPPSSPIEGFERADEIMGPGSSSTSGVPLPSRAAPIEGLDRGAEPARPDSGATAGLPLASRRAPGPAPAPADPAKPQAWTAKGSSVPRLAVAPAVARTASAPETPDTDAFDDDTHPMPGAGPALIGVEAVQSRAPVRPLDEPWWMVLGERIMTERPLQLLIAGGIAVIVTAMLFWPHQGHSVSVRNIKRHPEVYESETVRVHGRVEEVFPLGNGWVYDLRQGRDTITVFTQGAMPERHQNIEVVGQVSTGYLDGRPRIAILQAGGS
ncbi:MAG: hypothetical protein ACHQ52_00985 [Candidatus Eisenbacteria bacterium]